MFILTYIDMISRYPGVVPLRVTTSKAIAVAVLQIFCRLSIPEEILTDRGPNFMSTFMEVVLERMSRAYIFSTVDLAKDFYQVPVS